MDDRSESRRFERTVRRSDLRDAIYHACLTLSRDEARQLFDQVLDEITETLSRGEPVKLHEFGNFKVRTKRERIGRNPKTGVEAVITPRRVIVFTPSPALVARVNGRERPANARD